MTDHSDHSGRSGRSDDGGPSPLLNLIEVMARLRRECPWKAQQTHRSLARYLLEETYETIEAIEEGDVDHLREELGDVLLQVYFHAAIAAETDPNDGPDGPAGFDIHDVAAGLLDKLIQRNPHVFGDAGARQPRQAEHPGQAGQAGNAVDVNEQWERIKAAEKGRTDPLAGVPLALPALLRAVKTLDRLDRAGRTVRLDPASTDLGDRLLLLAAEAHAAGEDPEQLLRAAIRRLTD